MPTGGEPIPGASGPQLAAEKAATPPSTEAGQPPAGETGANPSTPVAESGQTPAAGFYADRQPDDAVKTFAAANEARKIQEVDTTSFTDAEKAAFIALTADNLGDFVKAAGQISEPLTPGFQAWLKGRVGGKSVAEEYYAGQTVVGETGTPPATDDRFKSEPRREGPFARTINPATWITERFVTGSADKAAKRNPEFYAREIGDEVKRFQEILAIQRFAELAADELSDAQKQEIADQMEKSGIFSGWRMEALKQEARASGEAQPDGETQPTATEASAEATAAPAETTPTPPPSNPAPGV